MRLILKSWGIIGLLVIFMIPQVAWGQKKTQKKYPGLLWQITGNGLRKPSYLFGTMHVSSKLAFNLGDSFYLGIKNSDVVALEIDPQKWQDQMYRFQTMQNNLRSYTGGLPSDYLNEKSFQLEDFEDNLRSALSEEPELINGLLYRTAQPKADFEEDTYLDLYIYQTGRKLGKPATGVENFFDTEKLILEATQDLLLDKKGYSFNETGEQPAEIEKKIEEAYRAGNLDLLDSLEKIMQPSMAYTEKFLYKRNEIQAKSIDSILKKQSLFVGVGAAHLPGPRGVIELLRNMGYHLRPIAHQARDEAQRESVEKLKVPVHFSDFVSEDGAFALRLPGKLYKRSDNRLGDSWQYADMSNGAYYMVTRVNTYAGFEGLGTGALLNKVDSLLYENIPGKIIRKSIIQKDGYRGFDISNRTRRGDIQRYNIMVTPYEVMVFKVSGNGAYVEGDEASNFFASIRIAGRGDNSWTEFEPRQGGFKIHMPGKPFVNKNSSGFDGNPRWEYQALDSINGDGYLLLKRSVQNFRFLEEDTFSLRLMEESLRHSSIIERSTGSQLFAQNGRPVLQSDYQLKDGSFLKARFFVSGPHFYLLAAHSQSIKTFSNFFDSFAIVPFHYNPYTVYRDSFVNIKATTPVVPDLDPGLRQIFERGRSEEFISAMTAYHNYWPHNKTAVIQDDSTGEAIYISIENFPKYYYPKDSASFWKQEMEEDRLMEDMVLKSKTAYRFNDSIRGYQYVYSDTGASALITHLAFVNGNSLYRIISLSDSALPSGFLDRFNATVSPMVNSKAPSLFANKLDLFFHDYYDRDSLVHQKAKDAISNIYFGPKAIPLLLNAIQSMPYNDRDYFATKEKLIKELGLIKAEQSGERVVTALKAVYDKAGDSSAIQNAVIRALAKNKTQASFGLLKALLLQDPPVFDNSSDYSDLFQDLGDSLPLARSLFPELLELSSIDDYKDNVRSLLAILVDSNYLKAEDYSNYFNSIYFDARIQLKKQLAHDELQVQKKNGMDNDLSLSMVAKKENDHPLRDFAVLLIPFYETNPNVPKFFESLLQSKDAEMRLEAAILMLRHQKPFSDSILASLAQNEKYSFKLYKSLESIHQQNRFPAGSRNQLSLAKSALWGSANGKTLTAIEFVAKRTIQWGQKSGWVYFFRYKTGSEEHWQMGISGIQPLDLQKTGSGDDLVWLTNKQLLKDKEEMEQFEEQLKHLLFSKRKSAISFFLDNDFYLGRNIEEN